MDKNDGPDSLADVQPEIATSKGMSVLVVEDDSASREIIVTLLNELGIINIVQKPGGIEACDFLDKNPQWRGIILCDWNMPRMTGAEMYNKVKIKHSDIPFIMVTGRNDEDSILYAKESGIYAYLLKPYSLEELERKINKVTYNHCAFLSDPIGDDTLSPYTI